MPTLKEHGWSQRRIAREVGIHPDTVGKYVHLRQAGKQLPRRSDEYLFTNLHIHSRNQNKYIAGVHRLAANFLVE